MLGINFKNDSWRNIYKKAKTVKDQKEQNQINQATLDYVQVLQMQIHELETRLIDLEESHRKEKFGKI